MGIDELHEEGGRRRRPCTGSKGRFTARHWNASCTPNDPGANGQKGSGYQWDGLSTRYRIQTEKLALGVRLRGAGFRA